MNYLTIYQSRARSNFASKNKYTFSEITESLLASTNTDLLVNYGCNLKWNLTDKHRFMLITGINCSTKRLSKPLI